MQLPPKMVAGLSAAMDSKSATPRGGETSASCLGGKGTIRVRFSYEYIFNDLISMIYYDIS